MATDAATKAERYLKESKKEIQRIKREIRALKKRGYILPDNAIPAMPKVATEATVRKYKAITPKTLYKKAVYVDPDTGKKVRGETRRKQERKAAAKKGVETKAINKGLKILANIRKIIDEYTPDERMSTWLAMKKYEDRDKLKNTLEGAIATDGEQAVAKRINESSEDIVEIIYMILYGYRTPTGGPGLQMNLAKFVSIIRGRPLTVKESMEYTEYGENEETADESQ